MNVFLSWSGDVSGKVATLLQTWLKCVLQGTEPWLSSNDIERGSLWFNDISDSLNNCNIGIICLTKSNLNAPWILFEAGSLLKGLSTNRVCTFLIDLKPKDVVPPLSQFNHTMPTREDMFKLISMLNERLEHASLDAKTLDAVFETYWPQFEREFKEILKDSKIEPVPSVKRSNDEILTEILYTVRNIDVQFRDLWRRDRQVSKQQGSTYTEEQPIVEPPSIPKEVPIEQPSFQVGDMVIHSAFGPGRIQDISAFGQELLICVDFEKRGLKKIIYSPGKKNYLTLISNQ